MSWHFSHTVAVATCLLAGGSMPAVAADPLAGTQWRNRVILVLATQANDPRLQRQRAIFERMGDDARERDLKLVVVVGETAQAAALRQRFDLPAAGFTVLLIGKDGGRKLTSDEPLDAHALFPTIDAMPMRQEEMRRRP